VKIKQPNNSGAALIIVLAFVVLLTGLVVAYFSRTVTDRQVAQGSFNQTKTDQLAMSATDLIMTDLKQEIANGSTAATVGSITIYTPTSNGNMVPMRSGTPDPTLIPTPTPIPNLVRRSVRTDPIPVPGVSSRASALNSTTDASANGRSVSAARWNRHYLVPKINTANDATDPVVSFSSPDWVFVTNTGPAVLAAPSTSVIGRYAYAVYDEGGLVDVNVSGFPQASSITQYGRKGSLAFGDLTTSPNTNPTGSVNLPGSQADNLVGWRNYATAKAGGTFPNLTLDATSASTYFTFILANTTGFLKTAITTPWNARTDQAFLTRQQLINFQSSAGFTANSLQYLTHFSREAAANTPQWSPAAPTSTNPNFQTLIVTKAGWNRADGSPALKDEPLVKKRFLLRRLNWLTYKGRSASRTIPLTQPPPGDADYDMWLLVNQYGLSPTFLKPNPDTSFDDVVNYFGLVWDATNERWNYIGHPKNPKSNSPLATSLADLDTLTETREPDFFELLRAGILDSSLGSSSTSDPALPLVHQQSKMLQILTIGANLITQARADSYPVRIACNVDVAGTLTTMEAVGATRLPYLSSLAFCPVAGTTLTSGGVNWFLVPNLWDPDRDNWDLTETTALTPQYPRPPVRITVTGSAGFGSATASQSGSVPSGSVTAFSTSLTFSNQSQPLKTGVTSGRDGLREASRLGTSDMTAALTSYPVTTSPTSAGFAWNSISRPPRPPDPLPGNDNFVVFRLSIPGSGIPTTSNGTNPVLILKSSPVFQMTVDYQSSNGTWYPYSFLQGNNATNTWISANLNLTTTFSQYGFNTSPVSTSPTVLHSSVGTIWDVTTLAQAPMFAKGDPRSIRYNSQIGVVNLSKPPMSVVSAGVLGPIWPDGYATPPLMNIGSNPATYSQTTGDNGPAASNPYNETYGSGVDSNPYRPIVMNRPFRSVGEMSYAFRDQPFKTVDFFSATSPDAALLDLFSVNEYNDASGMRAGVINLNSRQAGATAAVLKNTIRREDTARVMAGSPAAPSPAPSPITDTPAYSIATSLASLTGATPIVNRGGLTSLIANETGLGSTVQKTQRESIARALGETGQTRTWNLMIDVIAQSGRYPPGETNLAKFVVEGEQRYWVHVAIDRFTGEVIDRQVEVVKE